MKINKEFEDIAIWNIWKLLNMEGEGYFEPGTKEFYKAAEEYKSIGKSKESEIGWRRTENKTWEMALELEKQEGWNFSKCLNYALLVNHPEFLEQARENTVSRKEAFKKIRQQNFPVRNPCIITSAEAGRIARR